MDDYDKSLIELAAKAIDLELQWESDGTLQNRLIPTIPYDCHGMMTGIEWNPLKNDVDAFRLMVQLKLTIMFTDNQGVSAGNARFEREGYDFNKMGRPDYYAATRKAIVLVASEVGMNK